MAKTKKFGITLEGMELEFYNKTANRTDIYTVGKMQGRPGKSSISEHFVYRNGEDYKWIDINEIMQAFDISWEDAVKHTQNRLKNGRKS